MEVFLYEFLHFVIVTTAMTVSFSLAVLFFSTLFKNRQSEDVWKMLGFLSLAFAFFFFIFERSLPLFVFAAIPLEALGYLLLVRGNLINVCCRKINLSENKNINSIGAAIKKNKSPVIGDFLLIAVLLWVVVSLVVLGPSYLLVGIQVTTVVTLIFLIILHSCYAFKHKSERKEFWASLILGIAFFFLVLHSMAEFFQRLPKTSDAFFYNLSTDFSSAWQFSILFLLIGFIILGAWAWQFIKHRKFTRVYVLFLTISVIVAAAASFIFTVLIFQSIEKENIDLMTRASDSEILVMEERSSNALFISRLVANDEAIQQSLDKGQVEQLREYARQFVANSGVDYVRIYDKHGKVIVSPVDPRDEGVVVTEDPFLSFALTKKTQLKTFDSIKSILAPTLSARGLYPIISNGVLLGVSEAGYILDNAFVDFSKENTGLDVTMYVGDRRSATTITTQDGVSRWVGSQETNDDVLIRVLSGGENYGTRTNRLGIVFYSAYKPIFDINGQTIGMISVGRPVHALIEDLRKRLVLTFIASAVISFFATAIGYGSFYVLMKRDDLS